MPKNIQKSPEDYPEWKPFWMIVVAGKRGPKCKYHKLSDAINDADALCALEQRKTFIMSPIGIILPPGSGDLSDEEKEKNNSTVAEDITPYSGEVKKVIAFKKAVVKKPKKKVDKTTDPVP